MGDCFYGFFVLIRSNAYGEADGWGEFFVFTGIALVFARLGSSAYAITPS